MKKTCFLLIFFLLVLTITACASTNKNTSQVPDWYPDFQSAFPEDLYIAKMGEGNTAEEALAASKAEVAMYLNTSVEKVLESDLYMKSQNDSENGQTNTSEREISSKTIISTDLDLFALESEKAYYDKSQKKWFCLSYLDRKKSFEYYLPFVMDKKTAFYSVYNIESSHPIERIKNLSQAEELADDFINELYKLSMLSKTSTEELFNQDRSLISNIPGEVESLKKQCSFYVNVPVDSSKVVYSALTSAIKNMGYYVTTSKDNCSYTVDALVNYNREDEEDLIVMYPELVIQVFHKELPLYVYAVDFEKKISYNLPKIEKNVCNEMKLKIDAEFIKDFSKNFGLK